MLPSIRSIYERKAIGYTLAVLDVKIRWSQIHKSVGGGGGVAEWFVRAAGRNRARARLFLEIDTLLVTT
jgi:hypothetical protein